MGQRGEVGGGRTGAKACRNQKDVGRDDELVPVVDLHCFRLARRETARRPRRLQLRAKGGHIPCAPGRAAPSDPNMLSADGCADPPRKKGSADDDGALGKQVEAEVNTRSDAVKPWAWPHRAPREGGASIELCQNLWATVVHGQTDPSAATSSSSNNRMQRLSTRERQPTPRESATRRRKRPEMAGGPPAAQIHDYKQRKYMITNSAQTITRPGQVCVRVLQPPRQPSRGVEGE